MSDTYTVDDYMRETGREASAAAIGSFDDDPDKAARAIELGDASNVSPDVIYPNVEDFERSYKANLSSQIIRNNPHIAEYLTSNPMAPKVSHDDLGALDDLSQNLDTLHPQSGLMRWLKSNSIQQSFMKGFGEQSISPEGYAHFYGQYTRPDDLSWALSHPEKAAMLQPAVSLLGLGEIGFETMGRTFGGLVSLGQDALEPIVGKGAAKELSNMATYELTRGDIGVKAGGGGATGPLTVLEQNAELLNKMHSAMQLAEPWTKIDKEPPLGLHPLIDDAIKTQSRDDISALDEALSTATKSATRERAPDLFANFIRDHIGDRQIGIDPEAVRSLYGPDDIPTADDGKLGFVTDLKSQLEAAEVTGDDVKVPMADWLAKVDPEIAKQLHDDIRVRDNGMTINESKIEAEPKQSIADPVAMLRGAGGLEPLAQVGDRKVTLELKNQLGQKPEGTEGLHDVDIKDENGNVVGTINISEQKGGKQLYIDMIQAGSKESKFYQPNYLGPSLIRDIKRQLKTMFPNAESITGHRVSGARERAGVEMTAPMPVVKLQIAEDMGDVQGFRDLLQPYWDFLNPQSDIEILRGPFNEEAKKINADIMAELNRIAPQANKEVVHSIFFPKVGGNAAGLWSPRMQKIFISLESKGVIGTARHEAIHALRALGLIRDDEWQRLVQAAKDGNWIKRFNIDKNYANFTEEQQMEEAIAEGYRYWRKGEDILKDPTVFGRIKDFIDMVYRRIKEALGRDFTWEEIFKDIDTGRVGRREQPFEADFGDEAAHIEEPTGEEPSFGIYDRGKALGVTQSHMDRMLNLIQKRNEEDLQAANRRAEVRQRRRSNKEFKERRTILRDDVSNELQQRPDIAVDRLFTKQKVKFNPAYLTEDQRARLPKEYIQKKDGINPDDLAPYFGYTSGDALVERLGMLTEDRRRAGMSQRDYFNRLVDVETDRRLNQEFGDREQNILDEAKDQALSETQLNLVHEETMAYAYKAHGSDFVPQFGKDQVRDMVRSVFNDMPVGSISSDRMIQAAGRIGKKIEEAGSKGDWVEAYRLSQQRNHAMIAAKFAREYEKSRTQLDRVAKQFRKREIASVPAEYTNWVHDLLQRVGYPINRSIQDLAENIGRQKSNTLADFAEEKKSEWMGLRELPIEDWIKDPNFRKTLDKLTVTEFRQFKSAIDGLIKAGRDERKIYREGEAIDRVEYLDGLKQQIIDKFSPRKFAPGYEPGKAKQYIAGITSLATVFRRFDGGDRYGKFAAITNRMAEADNYEARLDRETAKDWTDIGKAYGDLSSSMDMPPTLAKYEQVYNGFTQENKLSLIHNAGNIGNWQVTVEGWGGDVNEAWQWLIRNSTKEEWDAAQAMGDRIFSKLAKIGDDVYERVTGSTVEKIPLQEFSIRFPDGRVGTYKGWYYPLIEDNLIKGKQPVRGGEPHTDYGHYSTSNGWTKKRTGVVYPVDLSFGQLPFRLSQMIHDITHRETILDTQKIFKDSGLHNVITKHYGKEYADLLMPWLEDAAGRRGVPSGAWGAISSFSNAMRSNAVSTYIGFNPSTPMKHAPTAFFMSAKELGWRNMPAFLEAYRQLHIGPNKAYYKKLVLTSEEIQRRERHWQDTFGGAQLQLDQKLPIKEQIKQAGSWVVAKSDRFSTDALWLARYNLELAEHGNIGLAKEQGDLSVRRAHGSTAPSNFPELVRRSSGGVNPWLTTVYGFMGERFQRLVETAHMANDTWGFVKKGEIDSAANKVLTELIPNYLIYVAMVGAVEEGVNAYFSESKDGPLGHLAKIGLSNIGSSFLFLRDIWHAAETGQSLSVGMLGSIGSDLEKALNDVKKGRHAVDRQHAGKTVRDLLTVGGLATGKMPKTIANAIGFGVDIGNSVQRPQTANDLIRGTTRGQMKRKVQR